MLTAPLAEPPTVAPAAASVTDTASTASWRGVTDAKKPSVLRRKLSLLLTPSSVMLRNPSGRPLIVESRFAPGVLMPGRNAMAFSALRVGVGMRVSWSELSVDATVAVSVLISSALLVTVTVSVRLPTSSVSGMFSGWPGATRTALASAVLNPVSDAVTVYEPASRAVTEYRPSASVTVSLARLVASSLTTTVTPGTTPPAASFTTPEIDAVACACAVPDAHHDEHEDDARTPEEMCHDWDPPPSRRDGPAHTRARTARRVWGQG